MGILNCDNISLHFGTNEVLNKITLNINQGDKVGIIGVNGAGKTTLFKIITGELSPTTGKVTTKSGASIGYLSQYTDAIYDELTVLDAAHLPFSEQLNAEKELLQLEGELQSDPNNINIVARFSTATENFKKIGGYEYKGRARSFLEKLKFTENDYNTKVSLLSGGQKTRLSLAILLLSNHDIYLLDEPTNHLDLDSIQWLEEIIRSSKKTFMIVSHDRFFLDNVTDHTVEIEHTTCMMYQGGYTEFKKKKKKLQEDQMKHYELQQKEIKRLEDFIANQRKWNRERNIIAAESRQKAIDRMVKEEKVAAAPKRIHFKIGSTSSMSEEVLTVKDLGKSFASKIIFKALSFQVKKNDRLFIIGPNGSGKSTLMKILTGRLQQDKGDYWFGYNQKIGYYDQEQQSLDESSTVVEELWNLRPTMTQTEVRKHLAAFNFRGEDVYKPISVLSGGERARLTIAKLVLDNISVLILDEPTNHLDINSREVLEEALSVFDGSIICVSHDRYFIKSLANRILEINSDFPDEKFRYFIGGYDDYLSNRDSLSCQPIIEEKTISANKTDYLQKKKEQSDKRKKETLIKRLEERSLFIEKRIKEIDALCFENTANYKILAELYIERELLEKELDEITEKLIEEY